MSKTREQAEELLAHDRSWIAKHLIIDGERVIRALCGENALQKETEEGLRLVIQTIADELDIDEPRCKWIVLEISELKKERDELKESLNAATLYALDLEAKLEAAEDEIDNLREARE